MSFGHGGHTRHLARLAGCARGATAADPNQIRTSTHPGRHVPGHRFQRR
jgi:hypothetical protein